MSKQSLSDDRTLTRRHLLRVSGGAIGAVGVGSARTAASSTNDETYCDQTTFEPGMVHYDDSMMQVCADDHPETEALQADVRTALEESYPTVGALIDSGFIPYFDFFTSGDWSHWINPTFIADDTTVDPERPESVLVDHTYWRPIGVMFIATEDGEAIDSPPSVYTTGDESENGEACTPWHAHVGFPGRYAWWKYQQVYEGGRNPFPCRTPWMMHVWIYPHPHSIYAHAAPEERGGSPATEPGFKTDADPNEETLGIEHLPDIVSQKAKRLR